MKLTTTATRAQDAAAWWARQYPDHRDEMKQAIHKQLLALGEQPSPENVNKITGNNTWTETKCGECGSENVEVVELAQCSFDDTYSAEICKICLRKALDL